MVAPEHQDLYLLQNEFGLIKIGRSIAVEERRSKLTYQDRARIEIVAVFSFAGDWEEPAHIALRKHRLLGEWFSGDATARVAIANYFKIKFTWPFDFDPDYAAIWLEHMQRVRQVRKTRQSIYRAVQTLKRGEGPKHILDAITFTAWREAVAGKPVSVLARKLYEMPVETRMTHQRTGGQVAALSFSTDLTAALQLWPDDLRPAQWEGSPLECSVAALEAWRRRLTEPDPVGLEHQAIAYEIGD